MSEEMLWIELGKIHTRSGSFDDAVIAFLKAININPESGLAYSNLAYVYCVKGEYGKAVPLYRKSIPLIKEEKEQIIAWNRLGDTYRVMKDLENAIVAYKRADDLEMTYALRARTYRPLIKTSSDTPAQKILENNPGSAVQRYSGSPKTDPSPSTRQSTSDEPAAPRPANGSGLNGSSSQISLASPIQRMGYDSSAGAASSAPRLETTASAQPSVQTSNTFRGVNPSPVQSAGPKNLTDAKKGQGKPDSNLDEVLAKVQIYENITRANPANDRAWDTLGRFYKILGRFPDAIAAYKHAIDIAPFREVYSYYLGLLYAVDKQYENAIQAFQNVIKINPEYALAHGALAGLYRRLGMEAKANEHITIAMPKMINENSYNRACFYATCGDPELAMEFLRLALQNNDTTLEWMLSDPDLDVIRDDPRFQKLVHDGQPAAIGGQNVFAAGSKNKNASMLEMLNNSLAR